MWIFTIKQVPVNNPPSLKKLERSFFELMAIDAENVLTFENCPLAAELKLKSHRWSVFFYVFILALPPEGAFQLSMHAYHLWPLGN